MLFDKKKKDANEESINDVYIDKILSDLKNIYTNKSTDEYKSKGDITKSPNYENIEYQLAQLSSIKNYPESDAKSLKDTFNVLHRPIFKKNVSEYMVKPSEKNIVFAMAFSTGYRLLIGELARVIASAEATDKGFVYKPNKITKDMDFMPLIRKFSGDIDKKLDRAVIEGHKKMTPVQEAATLKALGVAADAVVGTFEGIFKVINGIFKGAASLNPISLISAVLSRSYDKKVEEYEKISKEYELAKKAYDEYKKIPEAQRKKRIEHNYTKMIEKYNIKMNNLKAKIDHYDLRSQNDAEDTKKESTKKKADDKLPKSSSTVDTTSSKDDNKGSDDFDF